MKPVSEFQQITSRILFWEGYDPQTRVDLSCSAILCAQHLLLIDPLELAPSALEELLSMGAPKAILLTNGNHLRASEVWRKRFGIPIFAHAEAASELGIEADYLLQNGDTLPLDLEWIPLPGAGAGEIAIRDPAGEGTLFIGDALIHLPKYGFSVLPEKYCTDFPQMLKSLRSLLPLEFERILFAHGQPIVTTPRTRLEALLNSM